jgi:hypothetical protein
LASGLPYQVEEIRDLDILKVNNPVNALDSKNNDLIRKIGVRQRLAKDLGQDVKFGGRTFCALNFRGILFSDMRQ